jgi:hypothetical protein
MHQRKHIHGGVQIRITTCKFTADALTSTFVHARSAQLSSLTANHIFTVSFVASHSRKWLTSVSPAKFVYLFSHKAKFQIRKSNNYHLINWTLPLSSFDDNVWRPWHGSMPLLPRASSITLRHNNGLRGSGSINPASVVATAWEALTSSTPPAPQQWLEGLRHHRPRLRRNNSLRGSGIINPASAATMAWGAPALSRLEGLWHHRPRLHRNNDSRVSSISTRLRRSNGSRSSGIIDPPPSQQWLEELWHHRPHLCYSNGSRGPAVSFNITDSASITCLASSKSLSPCAKLPS